MSIMTYCAKSDPQASRLVYILTTFNHVIVGRRPLAAPQSYPEPEPVPNTPTGSMSNSSNDPVANFFLSNPPHPAQAVGTGAPASATFTPSSAQAHNPQSRPLHPTLHRRDSGDLGSNSPGVMQSALTPTASAASDLMNDPDWFHFDTLWENWAPGASAPGPSSAAAVTDPALFNNNPLSGFDGAGGGGGGDPSPFAPAELPANGRFNGDGAHGGIQVPLFPLMRFNE